MNTSSLRAALAAMAFAPLFVACGGGGGADAGSGGGIGGTGGMRVSLTDAPACGFDQVNITVDRVRVHADSAAADGDTGWHEIVVSPPRRIDLLNLTNGVLDELGEVALPAGRYSQLRLVLATNGGATPFANSVLPTGRAEVALTTPSAQQSGLKLKTAIDVPAGQVADVVLDFDACRSVVRRGNSGAYNLKPVITVTPVLSAAGLRVVGYVAPSIAAGASVSVQFQGTPVKATVPDPLSGRFTLYPVPEGTYDLVVTSTTRRTTVVTGVPVRPDAPTALNDAATPLLPPPATFRSITGVVSPRTANVRVAQALTGGPTVEVTWAPVDADTGAFATAVPVGATLRGAYGPTVALIEDAATGGRYTVQASDGTSTRETPVDANAPISPLVFTLP